MILLNKREMPYYKTAEKTWQQHFKSSSYVRLGPNQNKYNKNEGGNNHVSLTKYQITFTMNGSD